MKRRIAVMTMTLALLAGPAAAQLPGINVHVGARVGAFMPLGSVVESGLGESKWKSGLGVGASIELDIPFSPINVRANVDAALGTSLETDGQEAGAEGDIVALTGDLVFRPLPRIATLQPYLLLGGGVKQYKFDDSGTFSDVSDFTGHIGAGADLKVGPLAVLVEASDYISSFKNESNGEGKLQNDLFLMVGFRIGML